MFYKRINNIQDTQDAREQEHIAAVAPTYFKAYNIQNTVPRTLDILTHAIHIVNL